VRRVVTVSVDQLYRAQPGGIATYVRGLLAGLDALDDAQLEVVALAPRAPAPPELAAPGVHVRSSGLPLAFTTRLWSRWPFGVPATSSVVHATSMAGPFAGGRRDAVHSVALHDLLWRDQRAATTSAGARFHESRLRQIVRRDDLRLFLSSPDLASRLRAEGVAESRLHLIRLGVDQSDVGAVEPSVVARLLGEHGVSGPFTLYAGTREPRKNLATLINAHRRARGERPELGPLVLAGPAGWGAVDTADAVVLGPVAREVLLGLYRDATVFAYVAFAEGWGLPPVEALAAGTRIVASTTTPSVRENPEAVRVDPLDVDAVAAGLVHALELGDDESARDRRRASVADLTWRNCALDHVAGWR
jgi:glycosyltransferase involved in cell wall biosynthesis